MNVFYCKMYKTSSPFAVGEYTDDATDAAYVEYFFVPD